MHGGWEVSAGGGGAKYFFSGPKFPPSLLYAHPPLEGHFHFQVWGGIKSGTVVHVLLSFCLLGFVFHWCVCALFGTPFSSWGPKELPNDPNHLHIRGQPLSEVGVLGVASSLVRSLCDKFMERVQQPRNLSGVEKLTQSSLKGVPNSGLFSL